MAYCDRCERWFGSENGLNNHIKDSSFHWMCWDCDRDFLSWTGLRSHYTQSRAHFYCRFCDEHFGDDDELTEHRDDVHYSCWRCNKTFNTDDDLHDHNSETHWYCAPCRRVFQSESNLNAHENSSIHKPKNVVCPGKNCGEAFVSTSALLSHFEAGRCSSGMTRAELNRLVVRWDRNNLITNPSRLIAGPGRTYDAPPADETWATQRSWNGDAYECFLCHKTFATLYGLNAHLKSPRHQDKIYKCPNQSGCDAEFATLSGLTQHVETGSCGVSRFREVKNAMDSLVRGMKRLGM